MQIRTRFLALSAITLLLAACSKESVQPPLPPVAASPTASVGMVPLSASQGSDASVPSATSVFAAEPPASTAETASTRTNATLSDAQEKTAMPMAGQADSHSAPKATDKSASSP
ncbi:MAG: hypothetical protein Q8M01_06515 [Rubrivivax sp.]|nr:hypothetical protein [Rubrivivax sp.]